MNRHHELEQLTAGYVLGALEPDQEQAFAQHLDGCDRCHVSVRDLERVLGDLAYAAPPADPPPSLRASIRREAGLSWRRGLLALGRRPRVSTSALQSASRRDVLVARIAVVVMLVLVAAVAFWNFSLSSQVDADRQRIAALEEAARLVNDPTGLRVELEGDGAPGAEATVVASSRKDQGVLVVEGLPAPSPGRVYQLWALPQGSFRDGVPAGVFVTGGGLHLHRFALPIQPGTAFAVTEEPGPDGSGRPSSAPILLGSAQASRP